MTHKLTTFSRPSRALSSQELEQSLGQAKVQNVSLWDFLVVQRRVPEDALADALSRHLNLPWVRLHAIELDRGAVEALSGALARKHTCVPVRFAGKRLVLAMANPSDRKAIADVEFASSRRVEPVVACRTEILTSIERYYPLAAQTAGARTVDGALDFVSGDRDILDLEQPAAETATEASATVDLFNQIVVEAINLRASDIHIEPDAGQMRVRLRIDGLLREHMELPRWMRPALVSRVKVLAKLDIAQQRVPQDGRIKVKTRNNRVMDLRVSTLPTHLGEKAVLRLLGSASAPTLSALGLSAEELAILEEAVSQPQGLILVTGPTGTGKSTTLYSLLTHRNSSDINTVTIEDPIEYQLPGANQVQVDVKAGVTFASCLRAILRQDPDVIMVGEIRDLETAEISLQAALTGHLVLSTLHTNGSAAAIERLIHLGLKPMMLAAATNLIVAQRLARRVCPACREPYAPSADALRKLHVAADSHEFYHGRGCPACAQTGYKGRVGIFEILKLTAPLKELVTRRATESQITSAARAAGVRMLMGDALEKLAQGVTTAEEIARVIGIDHGGSHTPRRPHRRSAKAPIAPEWIEPSAQEALASRPIDG